VRACLHQSEPIYLFELSIPVAATAKRSHLRSAVQDNLVISYCRTKRYGQRRFAHSSPFLWNSLPRSTKNSTSVHLCTFVNSGLSLRSYYVFSFCYREVAPYMCAMVPGIWSRARALTSRAHPCMVQVE